MENTSPPSAPLFAAFMHDLAKHLLPLIVAELKHQTNAEGLGLIALDPNNLSLPVYSLMQNDVAIRDQIKDMIDGEIDHRLTLVERSIERIENNPTDNIDISDNDDFSDLQSSVSTLEERVGELEEKHNGTEVDADDENFQDAVRSVIRNHI